MLGWLGALGGWSWVVLGLMLMAGEMLAPGAFLVWLGLAALLTGIVVGFLSLSWQAAALVFAGFAIACVIAGRLLTRRRGEEPDAATSLNRGGRQLIGRVFTLDRTMTGGEGRLRIGDSSWRITGPELLAGSEVRVIRVEGGTLIVEKA